MKKHLVLLSFFLLCVILSGCRNFGKEKDYNGVELYHSANISDALADSLGKYLVDQKFADGKEKTVQITKVGDRYQFRFVVKAGVAKDAEMAKTIKVFGAQLSANVFAGAPLEIHLCDDQLKTLTILVADDYGKKKIFNGVELFYAKSITIAEVDSLGNYLISSAFASGKRKSVQITKTGNVYQFKFVIKQGLDKDPGYRANAKIFAAELSAKVFKNAPVEIFMCDEYFNALAVIPMGDVAQKI